MRRGYSLRSESGSRELTFTAYKNLGSLLTKLQDGTPALVFGAVNAALGLALKERLSQLEKQWDLMPLSEQISSELVPYYTAEPILEVTY